MGGGTWCDRSRWITKPTFVPFQQMFDNATQTAPATYWAEDGVHPSLAGHMLMARTWASAVTEF